MSRRRKNKHNRKATSDQKPTPVGLSFMDVVRAQDAAAKMQLANETQRVFSESIRTKTVDSSEPVRAHTRDGYENFLSRVGLPNDNTLSGGTYEFNLITRRRQILEAAYRSSWIVGRLVDSIAEDMTRAGIDVVTNSDDEDVTKLLNNFSRLKIWTSVASLIKWGRLYGGAIGVLQIDGQDPSTPLRVETIAKGQFKGIAVFDRWQLNPVLDRVIASGPDLGLPKFYQIVNNPTSFNPEDDEGDWSTFDPSGQVVVHHSRVIRYTGIDLPYFQAITEMMWGESVIERLWDRLISFDNATLSAAQLIDRANLRTVSVEGLRTIIAAGGEAFEGLLKHFEMMRLFQTNEHMTLLDSKDTFASTSYSFAGISDLLLQFGQQLSGASEIPLVRLFGQSPAGLSATGESDMRMYYDNIKAQQEAKLRAPFDTLLKVMWRSTFEKPAPDDLEYEFTPLWQMSAMDKATIAKTNTETIIGAKEAQLIPVEAAMEELRTMSGDIGLFSNITDQDITDAELEEPPVPMLGPGTDPLQLGPGSADDVKDPVRTIDNRRRSWRRMLGW